MKYLFLLAIAFSAASSFAAEDPHAEFLVYTDDSGLKYYEFDQEPRNHDKAIEHCEAQVPKLRLMTEPEARDLEEELSADESKLEKWLGGKRYTSTWTSSVYSADPNLAWFLLADVGGFVIVDDDVRDVDYQVRCVGQ